MITIGKHTYGNPIRRGEGNNIAIGKYCQIAEGVIMDGGFSHNTDFISTYPFNQKFPGCEQLTGHPKIKGDIHIGNDVWLGEQCVIMSGVTIGDGAIIGMRCIVSKDIPPYAIVAGAPQRILRYRYDKDRIDKLLSIKWWDWTDEKVTEFAPMLMSNNIESFLSLHYK